MIQVNRIVDWILTEKCNLNCYYCLQNADTRNAECKSVDYSFIDNISEPILFHLTGGEPFLVPNIIDLCIKLEQKGHYISMNTNLTIPVNTFIEKVKSEKFIFINASVHYPYRKHHMKPFIRHYMALREAGFFVYATIVMMPDEFEQISDFIKDYQSQGVILLPKLMRGVERGVKYPESYNDRQFSMMKNMVINSIEKMSLIDKKKFKIACENNVSIDNWWEFANNPIYGTRCFDGFRYIRITEKGDIVYCNGKLLGNIKTTGFTVLQDIDICPHLKNGFCKKNI